MADHPPTAAEPLCALLESSESGHALVCPDDGQALTGDQLAAIVDALAGRLHTLGVRPGDHVAVVLDDGPELIKILFALAAVGAAAAPLNPAYTAPEYAFFLGDLAPRLLLAAAGHATAAREAAGSVPIVDVVRRAGEHPALLANGEEASHSPGYEPGGPDDVALLLHTSGTTSRPKQVPLLQRNLVASARAMASFYDLGPDDRSYCAMPLFHVHGLVGSTLAPLAARGTVVVPRRFAPNRCWRQVREHGVTWLSASPTFHQVILRHIDQPAEMLRFTRSCSSALTPAVMERTEQAYGVPVLQAYGMTETSHQIASNPLPPAPRQADSVGVSAGASVRVVDDSWEDVATGVAGEVVVAGAGVTPGYLGNDDANAASFRDGWFRTGDIGVLVDGYLSLKGRLKEMIIRGGDNISPTEIDEVLLAHPAVSEAVCFGVDDEMYGQVVEAAVVLSQSVTVQELAAHCRRSLAAYKVPGTIRVVDAIPRTPTGKVQRRRVAAELAGKH